MPYIGSTTELNDITGVTDVIVLDSILETEYANKIFKPNILIWKSLSKTLHLTDGVKPVSELEALTVPVATILNHINDVALHSGTSDSRELSEALAALEQNKMDKTTGDTFVHITGDEVIAGNKTFSATIVGNINGIASKALADGNSDNIVDTYLKKDDASDTYATKTELTTHTADTSIHLTADIVDPFNNILHRLAIADVAVSATIVSLYT